jgi:hypothetical protein
MSCEIINHLNGIETFSYLELGIRDNKNFEKINCKELFSVDINGRAMFTGTTDDYFAQLTDQKFDIIFIDANHDAEYVVRDFNNSIKRCQQWVLIHDMIPPSVKYTASKFCSDSFRVLHHLLSQTKFEIYPMNENYGLTLIRMPAEPIVLGNSSVNLSFGQFQEFIADQRLYTRDEIIQLLRNQNV